MSIGPAAFWLVVANIPSRISLEAPIALRQSIQLASHPFGGSTLFSTTFYVITGFHGFHVLSGVIYLSTLLLSSLARPYGPKDADKIEIAGLYWHFVDLVWILVFTFVYLI